MLAAAGRRSYRQVGDMTRTHPETARRYMSGQSPSAEFLSAFCAALGISADWLLTGRGPMRLADQKEHTLREADASDLLGAMAATIEDIVGRLDRVELYVQTMETRVRAKPVSGVELKGGQDAGALGDAMDRVRRIADAIANRPRADDRRDAPAGGP